MEKSKNTFAEIRSRLLDVCERVESGFPVSKAENYFYTSLAYFQEGQGNSGAINEFLNVAQAAGLI